jgi:peptide/nickel transport system permease protein
VRARDTDRGVTPDLATAPTPIDDGSNDEIVERSPRPGDQLIEAEATLAEPLVPEQAMVPLGKRRSKPVALLIGAALSIVGIVLVVLGTTVLRKELVMTARVAFVLVGAIVLYLGIARVIRAITGPRTDVAYWLALVWLVVLVAVALLAPLLPLGESENSARTLSDPINARPQLFSEHPLGTNRLGLDLLARVVYGARTSLMVALLATAIGMSIGGAFGLISGYLRGVSDSVIGIVTNVLLAFPPLVLLLALAAVLPRTARNQALTLALLVIPVNVRLARATTLSFSQREFVLAARAMGAKRRRIMLSELLPNVFVPLLSYAFIVIAVLIVAEASLSFLGLGLPQPSPTWGNMIAEGRNGVFEREPHLVVVPATVLFLTVLSFNLVGERLRARFAGGKQVEL